MKTQDKKDISKIGCQESKTKHKRNFQGGGGSEQVLSFATGLSFSPSDLTVTINPLGNWIYTSLNGLFNIYSFKYFNQLGLC